MKRATRINSNDRMLQSLPSLAVARQRPIRILDAPSYESSVEMLLSIAKQRQRDANAARRRKQHRERANFGRLSRGWQNVVDLLQSFT